MQLPSHRTLLALGFTIGSMFSLSFAQDVSYDATHNVTSLLGTWSSGSGNVKTGPGFANPLDFSFQYPKTTGISYSFTVEPTPDGGDGYFEEAQYRFQGNGSRPTCIVGVVIFQHGSYQLLPNGSMVLNPIPSDGRIQVQDMCASKTNIIQQFNQTTLFSGWRITQDAQRGPKLQLYRFDGAPLSPQYLISETPEMLPVEQITPNVTNGQRQIAGASTRFTVSGLGFGGVLGATGLALGVGLLSLL